MTLKTTKYILGIITLSFIILSCKKNEVKNFTNDTNQKIEKDTSLSSKIFEIKSFMVSLKSKEDENWGSKYGIYLIFKKINRKDGIEHIESEQSIYGKLPLPSDTIAYYNCVKEIKSYPKKKIVRLMSETQAIKTWQCLTELKNNLIYFLPEPLLEKFKTRKELIDFIEKNTLTNEEVNRIIKSTTKVK